MKEIRKELKQWIIFVCLVLISIVLANEFYYLSVIEKKLQFRQEAEFQSYLENNNSIEYIFLGDSHTQRGINPKYINDSYNFGFGANSYIENYYKLQKLIYKDKVRIKYIFMEMDLHSFSSYMINPSFPLKFDSWYYSRFVSPVEMAELTNKSPLEIIMFSYLPFIGNGVDFLTNKDELSELYLGWQKSDIDYSKSNMSDIAAKRVNLQFFQKERLDQNLMKYYLKTLKLAKDNNISIILIKYPISMTYDETLRKEKIERTDYYNSIFNSTNSVIENYMVLDYSNLLIDCSECFSDSDHLNSLGAEILSKQIYKDIQDHNSSFSTTISINRHNFS